MTKAMNVGIIGCGNISNAYFKGGQETDIVNITACADIFMDAAKKQAEEYAVEAKTVDELLADPDIELIINLTIPQAHKEIAIKCLEAGKHTYSEKPFALSIEDGEEILAAAKKSGLRAGCAPDTFMGAGIQTAIKCINDGMIG
ncbi:MAG: Gfo/Idh/MocA family oxidoreductase, partial [Planctomycetes bacterium]|nr:Gfo/Idh/MocA family oxidoreductase [Planctomycetota bacterium]